MTERIERRAKRGNGHKTWFIGRGENGKAHIGNRTGSTYRAYADGTLEGKDAFSRAALKELLLRDIVNITQNALIIEREDLEVLHDIAVKFERRKLFGAVEAEYHANNRIDDFSRLCNVILLAAKFGYMRGKGAARRGK